MSAFEHNALSRWLNNGFNRVISVGKNFLQVGCLEVLIEVNGLLVKTLHRGQGCDLLTAQSPVEIGFIKAWHPTAVVFMHTLAAYLSGPLFRLGFCVVHALAMGESRQGGKDEKTQTRNQNR